VVSFTTRSLYPQGKSPWCPLDRRLGGSQSRYGRGGEEKNSQPPPGIKTQNQDRPARSLVAILTELSRLFSDVDVLVFTLRKLVSCSLHYETRGMRFSLWSHEEQSATRSTERKCKGNTAQRSCNDCKQST
jgi:hypothetical protein